MLAILRELIELGANPRLRVIDQQGFPKALIEYAIAYGNGFFTDDLAKAAVHTRSFTSNSSSASSLSSTSTTATTSSSSARPSSPPRAAAARVQALFTEKGVEDSKTATGRPPRKSTKRTETGGGPAPASSTPTLSTTPAVNTTVQQPVLNSETIELLKNLKTNALKNWLGRLDMQTQINAQEATTGDTLFHMFVRVYAGNMGTTQHNRKLMNMRNILLKFGADFLEIKNAQGRTAMALARHLQCTGLVNYLQGYKPSKPRTESIRQLQLWQNSNVTKSEQ